MAVEIRLARHGRRNLPFYRIVVTDKIMPRDGRYIELVGTLNTRLDPPAVTLKSERVKYWIGVGAKPSARVASIIKNEIPGLLEELTKGRLAKLQGIRKKRKAAAQKAKRAKGKKSEGKARRQAARKAARSKPKAAPKAEAAAE